MYAKICYLQFKGKFLGPLDIKIGVFLQKDIVFLKLVLIKLSLIHLFSKEQGSTVFKCHSPFNDLEEIHKSCVSCSLLPG